MDLKKLRNLSKRGKDSIWSSSTMKIKATSTYPSSSSKPIDFKFISIPKNQTTNAS